MKINGAMTSLAVDGPFWEGLQEIARLRGVTATALVNEIDKNRSEPNLSSAVRVFVVQHFMALARGQGPSCGTSNEVGGDNPELW